MRITIFNNELTSVREQRGLTVDIEKDGKEYNIECDYTYIDADNMASPDHSLDIITDELKDFSDDEVDNIKTAIIDMVRRNEIENNI